MERFVADEEYTFSLQEVLISEHFSKGLLRHTEVGGVDGYRFVCDMREMKIEHRAVPLWLKSKNASRAAKGAFRFYRQNPVITHYQGKIFRDTLSSTTWPGKDGVIPISCGLIAIKALHAFIICPSSPYIRSTIFSSRSNSLLFSRYSE